MPVHLSWEGLRYSVPVPASGGCLKPAEGTAADAPRQRVLLDDLHGQVPPGSILAIMGASGAGKSTFLSAITGRIPSSSFEGRVLINGEQPDPASFPRILGFCSQSVPFLAFLSVRETLMYAARLRLPESLSKVEKARRVDALLAELDLTRCVHTQVGIESQPGGISGGERRRLALACELLHEPQLLIADEITSGLDSASSLRIVLILRRLARVQGRTIILTLHQPRAELMPFFDQLLLLSGGRTAYLGPTWSIADAAAGYGTAAADVGTDAAADGGASAAPAAGSLRSEAAATAGPEGAGTATPDAKQPHLNMLTYFASIGYPFPPFANPADVLIDLVNSDHDALLEDVANAEAAAAAASGAAPPAAAGSGVGGVAKALAVVAAAVVPVPAPAPAEAPPPVTSDGSATLTHITIDTGGATAGATAEAEGPASPGPASPSGTALLQLQVSSDVLATAGPLSPSSTAALAPRLKSRKAGMTRQAAADDLVSKYAASPLALAAKTPPATYPPRATPAFGGSGKRRYPTNWCTQMGVVLERTFWFKLRNPDAALSLFIGTVIMSVIIAAVFWKLPLTASGVRDRISAVAFLILTQSFAAFDQVVVAPVERPVALRDEQNGAYSMSAFYVGRTLADVPLQLLLSLIVGIITFHGWGLAGSQGMFLLIIVLASATGAAMLTFVGCVSSSMAMGNGIATVLLVFASLFNGFFIADENVPAVFRWIQQISFPAFGVKAASVVELKGLTFTCSPTDVAAGCTGSGNDLLAAMGLGSTDPWVMCGWMLLEAVIFRVLGFLALNFMYTGESFSTRARKLVGLA